MTDPAVTRERRARIARLRALRERCDLLRAAALAARQRTNAGRLRGYADDLTPATGARPAGSLAARLELRSRMIAQVGWLDKAIETSAAALARHTAREDRARRDAEVAQRELIAARETSADTETRPARKEPRA